MFDESHNATTVQGRARKLALLACTALLALVLSGCAGAPPQGDESSDAPSKNRAYMAQVNQQMADLGKALEEFQVAVGEGDAVAMQASQAKAGRIIEQVKAAEAPSMLADVKAGYSEGLQQLQQALADYVQLYNDAQAGRLDEAAFNERLAQVQAAYDAGLAALKKADEAAVAVANADAPLPGSSQAASSQAASSAPATASSQASAGQAAVAAQAQAQSATEAASASASVQAAATQEAPTQEEAAAPEAAPAEAAPAEEQAPAEAEPSNAVVDETAAEYQGEYQESYDNYAYDETNDNAAQGNQGQ